jgi:hypothetical protein
VIPFLSDGDIRSGDVLLICDIPHIKSVENEYPYAGDVNFTVSLPVAYPPHIYLSLCVSQSLKVFEV